MHEIAFADRNVVLAELRQSRTYEGLLEGVPRTMLNERFIARALDEATQLLTDATPLLVPALSTPIDREPPTAWGAAESLPAICCIARLRSRDIAIDDRQDFSMAVVVWFQQDFALPIDASVLAFFAGVDWRAHAPDYGY